MSESINQNYKEGLEKYKGKILGFTKNGMAVYGGGIGCQAIDTCECCGQIIYSQLCGADFCPICALMLGLTTEEFIREYCSEEYGIQLDNIENDTSYKNYYRELTTGFKKGMQFTLKHARSTLQHIVGFDYHNE